MRVRSVADTILGEAAYGTPEQRYADMLGIASVIANRANMLGVSPQDVVANPREFNAYGKALPPGAAAYRNMAQQAIDHVMRNGPTTKATFYATPSAAKNLPSGLSMVGTTSGHQYYSDPKNRAIGTALGYRQPSMAARQVAAVNASSSIPTPTPRPSFQPEAPAAKQVTPMDNVGLLGTTSRFADPMTGLRAGLLAQAQAAQEQKAAAERAKGYAAAVPGLAAALAASNHPANTLDGLPPAPTTYDRMTYNFGQQAVTPAAEAYAPTPSYDNAATGAIARQSPASGPVYDAAAAKAAAQANFDHKMHSILGTVGAAALGSLALGPIGGIIGGYLGRKAVDKADKYPSKPDAPDRGLLDGTSHADVANSAANRAAVSKSSQARGLSKNSVGLF